MISYDDLLPLVPKGGSVESPKKTTFPREFCNEICTIYICTIKNHNCGNYFFLNVALFQNGGQITYFYFASFRLWPKFEKTPFPKEFFQWNLAQSRRTWLDLHYWNNIFKELFRFKMGAKTIIWYCAILLVYASKKTRLRKRWGRFFFFFFFFCLKRSVSDS